MIDYRKAVKKLDEAQMIGGLILMLDNFCIYNSNINDLKKFTSNLLIIINHIEDMKANVSELIEILESSK